MIVNLNCNFKRAIIIPKDKTKDPINWKNDLIALPNWHMIC